MIGRRVWFAAAALLVAVACRKQGSAPPVKRGVTMADSAEQVMVGVRMLLTDRGVQRGELFADTAYVFDDQTRFELRKVRATFTLNRLIGHESLPALLALSQAVPVMLAKGLAFCQRFNAWSFRQTGDVDIHVRQGQLHRAVDILTAAFDDQCDARRPAMFAVDLAQRRGPFTRGDAGFRCCERGGCPPLRRRSRTRYPTL